jgi:type II secretory pathway component PulK
MKLRRAAREPRRRARLSGERGIALLLVMTLVVMFTAFVVDFSYTSRVRYIMASRARDAAKAEYIAKSGLRMYQLLLIMGDSAQDNIQKRIGGLNNPGLGMLQSLLGSGSMVVRLIPVLDTGLLRMLTGAPMDLAPEEGGGGSSSADAKGPTRVDQDVAAPSGSFLDFEGDFAVSAKEEGSKISLQALAKFGKLDVGPAVLLLQTLKREEYQPLFRASNITPEELVSNIIDWADPNGERANGQGYEDNLYNHQADPYGARNSPYDTVAELHLVAGMNDDLYNIIAPLVSPYSDADGITLPLSMDKSGEMLFGALISYAMAGKRVTPADIDKWWNDYQINAVIAPPDNAQSFIQVLQGIGVVGFDPQLITQQITDKKRPKQFTLTAKGRVGDVERTIQAVINIGQNRQLGGRLLYWREE